MIGRFACVALAGMTAATLLVSAPGGVAAQRRSGPISCSGNKDLVVRNRVILTSGIAVNASGNCTVKLFNCTIKAGRIGVRAVGNSDVHLIGCSVRGRVYAVRVGDNATVHFKGTSYRGRVRKTGNGDFKVKGGSILPRGPRMRRPARIGVRTRGAAVGVGPGGVFVGAPGARVQVGTGRVGVGTPGARVRVGGRGVGVRTPGAAVRVGAGGVAVRTPSGAVRLHGHRSTGGVTVRTDALSTPLLYWSDSLDALRNDVSGVKILHEPVKSPPICQAPNQ